MAVNMEALSNAIVQADMETEPRSPSRVSTKGLKPARS